MKGFAFPRRFKSAASLLATLTRNNRELLAFLNTFTVRFNSDASTVALPGDLSVAGDLTVTSDLTVTGDIVTDAWTAPTLLNSWVNFGSNDRVAGYKKTSDGTVHIKGMVKDGTSTTAIIFTLPTAYRPERVSVFAGRSSGGNHAEIRVGANGSVWVQEGGSTTWSTIEAVFQIG